MSFTAGRFSTPLISELQVFPGFPKSKNNFQVDVSLEFATYEIRKIEMEGIFSHSRYPWKVFKKEACILREFVGFFKVKYTLIPKTSFGFSYITLYNTRGLRSFHFASKTSRVSPLALRAR